MNDIRERTTKLKEAVEAKVSGVSVQEEENVLKTLRWLDFKDAKKHIIVEVAEGSYGVSEITPTTGPFETADQVFKTHDEALVKIVETFETSRNS